MTNEPKDNLFVLVKSLTKSEKRQFTLYVGRMDSNEDSKFLNLFQLLDKINRYDEKLILSRGIVSKQQLSNLKAHLYKQILISLRMNPMHKNIRIQIREQLDFATILYQKGLYKQSLKVLEKAKLFATKNEEKYISYENEKKELEKIILCDVPKTIYPNLEKIFISLLTISGLPEIKLEKKIDFEKLYNERLN